MAIDLQNLIDINLLAYFKTRIDMLLVAKVNREDGKGLSEQNYSAAEKIKLAGVSTGAQVNVVEGIQLAGANTTPVNKIVNIPAATQQTVGLMSAEDKLKLDSTYTKTEVDQKLVGAMNYKGTKSTIQDLPPSGNSRGDVWHVNADGSEWAWNGSSWDELGTAVDLSGYVEETDLSLATSAMVDALFGNVVYRATQVSVTVNNESIPGDATYEIDGRVYRFSYTGQETVTGFEVATLVENEDYIQNGSDNTYDILLLRNVNLLSVNFLVTENATE